MGAAGMRERQNPSQPRLVQSLQLVPPQQAVDLKRMIVDPRTVPFLVSVPDPVIEDRLGGPLRVSPIRRMELLNLLIGLTGASNFFVIPSLRRLVLHQRRGNI